MRAVAAALTTEALKAELARLLGFTAENLLRLAVVVAELEKRGEDLSDLKIGLLPILRQIAAGTLLPDIVVLYAGRPAAIRQIGAMPVEEQQRYARQERTFEEPPIPPRPRRLPPTAPPVGSFRPLPRLGPDDEQNETSIEAVPLNPSGIAAKANPRDVGEMVAEMILKCTDRQEAWRRLVDKLSRAGALTNAATIYSAVTPPPKVFKKYDMPDDD